MEYNYEYINLKYELLKSFLIPADRSILDISYTVTHREITIQIILMEGSILSDNIKTELTKNLLGYELEVQVKYLTKEQFNENKGEWEPKYYTWLDILLFSKAEVL